MSVQEFLLLSILFAFCNPYVEHATATTAADCHRTCGGVSLDDFLLPSPFGFTPGCQIQLNCTQNGTMAIHHFPVQDISHDSLLVDIQPRCGRSIKEVSYLFGPNYAPTTHNGILMQNCTSNITSSCIIPNTMVQTHFEQLDCVGKNSSSNMSCYSEQNKQIPFMNYQDLAKVECSSLFSGISVEYLGFNSSAVSLNVQVIKLGWWLLGACPGHCSDNANCSAVVSPDDRKPGYTCRCLQGFTGDGYSTGSGCRKENQLIPGDELNSTSNLVSNNGKFTLGFFTIPSTNFTYLGIWYTDTPNGVKLAYDKLWVANRDIPMIGNGVLTIDDSGTLKVINGSGTTLFTIFNNNNQVVGTGNNNTRAVLQDSGDFLVYDSTENRNLWQSFDYPTDTLLPGMKLGYNLTTKQNWTLNSWLSEQIPATGSFTMRLEQYQNSPQLLIYRHGEIYWASGPWEKENGTFQFTYRVFSSNFQNNFSLISDASGMYLTSSTLQLTFKGQIIDSTNLLLTPQFCYGYQSDDGCAVSALLPNCRAQIDSFVLKSGGWTGGSSNYDDNSSISLNDCMEKCWKDCSCLGFATNSNGTGCITWSGDKPFQVDESGQAVQKYVLVSQKPHKNRTWIWILVSFAIVLTFALTCCLCYVRIRRRRVKAQERRMRDDYIHQLTGGSDSFNYGDELERGIQDAPDVKIFSLGAILTATNNFSNENKLGQGGYGPVYKGELFDGREIAVKRLSKASGQGIEEFKSELILITKLQHTNLVRLYGCCIHQEEKMLIYEFMPNKSLDFFLFAEDKKEKIDWHMRFNIIEGVAQGLLYLHKYSRMKVIHRDLKVSNVLLDRNMNPKIADFGMARIFKQDVTEAVTNRVVGTYGYMAPEYAMEGTFSIKSDVFSFGVLTLEIISGKRNSSFYNLDRPLNLVGYAWELWKGQAALELKDKVLGESCDVKQLLRAIHIGLLCVQENADDRPTMSEVISMLNNEIADFPTPKQPAFFTGRQAVEFRLTEAKSTDYLLDEKIPVSENDLTISTMEAR